MGQKGKYQGMNDLVTIYQQIKEKIYISSAIKNNSELPQSLTIKTLTHKNEKNYYSI
mgnify:CR=1 FL=1